MSNIVVPVLSVTIGLFFVLVGTIKLTPFLSEDFYKEMVVLYTCSYDCDCVQSPQRVVLNTENNRKVLKTTVIFNADAYIVRAARRLCAKSVIRFQITQCRSHARRHDAS